MTSRIASLALTATMGVACAQQEYSRLYTSQRRAPSLTSEQIESLDYLGPTIIDRGVNFAVYSEHATRIELLLFDDPESALPTEQFKMHKYGDVWNIYIEGLGLGQHYGYVAWGPNWPQDPRWFPGSIYGFLADVDADGNRFNPNKLLFDPYGKALHRDHDWSKGSVASGPDRTISTYAAAAKTLIVASQYQWSANEQSWRQNRQDPNWPGHAWNDLILYEVHPKGFTASPASGVEHPGTYRGFGEKADYLEDLGITAVELMPVQEKPVDGGYWGYQTLSFFAPEISYASRREREEPIDEFKWMVDELHQRGIEVILDVVYNHTGEGGLWREKIEQDDVSFGVVLANFDPKEIAGLYSYRGLDNAGYYALADDNQTYWNDTGVGNQTRANNRAMRRLIMDSLRYWVEEMHVDGFRFDLAPILGMADRDYSRWDPALSVLQQIIDDPVLRLYNTRIISEPWAMGWQGFQMGNFPSASDSSGVAWYDWNAHFRDAWRCFVNDDTRGLNGIGGTDDSSGAASVNAKGCWVQGSGSDENDIGKMLTGSDHLFADDGRRPYHSINFVSVHDGFPMYDLFTFADKVNACGLLNPTCCSDPLSPFCERVSGEDNNRSRDWGPVCGWQTNTDACEDRGCRWQGGGCEGDGETFKRQLMRNMFVALMISHGTPMLLGGDEWIRTQFGNNNAYSTGADNHWNWFDWGAWKPANERRRMHDFVRQLTRFRKERSYAFAPLDYTAAAPVAWKTPQNVDMQAADWNGRALMQHYWDGQDRQLAILINMTTGRVTFTLPGGVTWQRLIDTQSWYDSEAFFATGGDPKASANASLATPVAISGAIYEVRPRSIVVVEAVP